jgi:hypothetical protein
MSSKNPEYYMRGLPVFKKRIKKLYEKNKKPGCPKTDTDPPFG